MQVADPLVPAWTETLRDARRIGATQAAARLRALGASVEADGRYTMPLRGARTLSVPHGAPVVADSTPMASSPAVKRAGGPLATYALRERAPLSPKTPKAALAASAPGCRLVLAVPLWAERVVQSTSFVHPWPVVGGGEQLPDAPDVRAFAERGKSVHAQAAAR